MDKPDKIGIDKLSLIFLDTNSVSVAINAPTMITNKSIPKLNKDPIMQHVAKHAIEPDKVL